LSKAELTPEESAPLISPKYFVTVAIDFSSHTAAMKSIFTGLVALALAARSQAIYFYIDGTTPKCFYEELPKDTLVVGLSPHPVRSCMY
jgi:hypothetical protein